MSVYLDHVKVDAIRIHRVKGWTIKIEPLKHYAGLSDAPPSSYVTILVEQDDGTEPTEIMLFIEDKYLDQVNPSTITGGENNIEGGIKT